MINSFLFSTTRGFTSAVNKHQGQWAMHSSKEDVCYIKYAVFNSKHEKVISAGLAKRVGARVLIASTSEVYGDPEVHPQPESYWGHVNPIGKMTVTNKLLHSALSKGKINDKFWMCKVIFL
jgi:hypothetical protein